MTDLQIFNNPEFGEIRAVEVDGEPWFVGKDMATALGYSNPRDALAKHVDDEDKNTVAFCDGTPGNPNLTIINESGVYSLIFSSRLEKAKEFKRWVTAEVLPTIRKHGTYIAPGAAPQGLEAAALQAVLQPIAATMEEVIRLMDENQTSGLPVVNGEGALVGFVSDGDVASYLGKTEIALVDSTLLNGYRYIDDETEASRLRELLALNGMAVATRRVVSVQADTPVDEVCSLFAAKRIKKVPVVSPDGKLVGALSRRNIMRSLVEAIDLLEK